MKYLNSELLLLLITSYLIIKFQPFELVPDYLNVYKNDNNFKSQIYSSFIDSFTTITGLLLAVLTLGFEFSKARLGKHSRLVFFESKRLKRLITCLISFVIFLIIEYVTNCSRSVNNDITLIYCLSIFGIYIFSTLIPFTFNFLFSVLDPKILSQQVNKITSLQFSENGNFFNDKHLINLREICLFQIRQKEEESASFIFQTVTWKYRLNLINAFTNHVSKRTIDRFDTKFYEFFFIPCFHEALRNKDDVILEKQLSQLFKIFIVYLRYVDSTDELTQLDFELSECLDKLTNNNITSVILKFIRYNFLVAKNSIKNETITTLYWHETNKNGGSHFQRNDEPLNWVNIEFECVQTNYSICFNAIINKNYSVVVEAMKELDDLIKFHDYYEFNISDFDKEFMQLQLFKSLIGIKEFLLENMERTSLKNLHLQQAHVFGWLLQKDNRFYEQVINIETSYINKLLNNDLLMNDIFEPLNDLATAGRIASSKINSSNNAKKILEKVFYSFKAIKTAIEENKKL